MIKHEDSWVEHDKQATCLRKYMAKLPKKQLNCFLMNGIW